MEALWLLLPAGQRRSGEWIDDTLVQRVRERSMEDKWPLAGRFPRQRVEVVRGVDPHVEVNTLFYRRGWTDGLPIVPPTLERVDAAVRASGRRAGEEIGVLEPLGGAAPEYLPVIVAAVEAILDADFNLRGVQTTDENVTPLLIVNGPVAAALQINGSYGALGPGWQANGAIGRAVRLIMNNIGGGWPAVVSFAGLGQPGRYALCLAENAAASPWDPLHLDAGFGAGQSTVTVTRAETMINVTGGLEELASVMASAASAFTMLYSGKVVVVLAPHVARDLAAQGWSKQDVKIHLHGRARLPTEVWRRSWLCTAHADSRRWPDWVASASAGDSVPVLRDPDDITVVVAGGDMPIPQCAYFPSWGFPPCCVTREIGPIKGPASGSMEEG